MKEYLMSLEKFSLKDRIAVVTGAGRGIGREIARAMGEAGAVVIVAEIMEDTGRAAERDLLAAGFRARYFPLDVTDPDAVERAAGAIVAEYGRVDILVNNAGYANNIAAVDYPTDEYYRLMRINLDGVMFCSRAFGRHMIAAGRGSIVNIGSMSGIIVNKPQPQAPYNASKAAVHMLTKSLACEWAKYGVRVNAVAPGYINTEMTLRGRTVPEWNACWLEMTPMGRCGEPAEVASVVQFLASDAASYITGSVVSVDGGYTAW
jgi:NAD(P)-dependent dehydrogenase (short-subunit alcohol dehydrogenase family)